ncbi:MAG: sigma-70 family RNA polymerase sigma factor [Acidobacteriota bacterium]
MTASTAELRDLDFELVERHLHGDETAFEELYEQHADMVYNLSLRMAGNPEQAADWTQEIFLRIFRHLSKFRGGARLSTWIYRIALNYCNGRLQRRRRNHDDRPLERLVDPRRSPEANAAASDTGRQVAEALEALPRRYREAVVLRDLEGLAYSEIAEITGSRIGTVRSRIARGRDRLRKLLETDTAETPA